MNGRKLGYICVSAALLLLLAAGCAGLGEKPPELGEFDLVISPAGSDGWSGRLFAPNRGGSDGPLATLERAKALLAEKKAEGAEGATIWVRGGEYYFSEPAVFSEEDMRGTKIRAYPGETPVFDGAAAVSGWKDDEINGVPCWSASAEGLGEITALFLGMEELPVSRYPETGYFTVAAISPADMLFTEETAPWPLTRGDRAFYADPEELGALDGDISGVCVRVLHYWKDELLPLKGYDPAGGKLSFENPATMTVSAGERFFLENVRGAVKNPGQWYWDRGQEKLYYIPKAGETPEKTALRAGTRTELIKISGCGGLTFEGITFARTGWSLPVPADRVGFLSAIGMDFPQAAYAVGAAVAAERSENIGFVSCTFKNIGNSALRFGANMKNSEVRSCLFDNIGGNAVYISGENSTESLTGDITVTDNHITKYGRRFFGAIGVLLIHAESCEISFNEIHDGYYTAISAGWVWGYGDNPTDNLTIKNNLIYNIGQGWLSDMGGIYTLGKQPNTVISGNLIHDVAADPGQGGYGGWGIYLDEGSSGITVEKNLVYDCGSHSFHQHYGKENLLKNNIFAFSKEAQIRSTRDEGHIEFILEGNIIVSAGSGPYDEIYGSGRFTDKGNLYYDYESEEAIEYYKKFLERRGYFVDAVVADPLFADAANRDFTLDPASPVFAMGFEAFDYLSAGTITDFTER